MGYYSTLTGEILTDKKLDTKTFHLLDGLFKTRRMKRSGLPAIYGIDGEFFCEDKLDYGQTKTPSKGVIVDYNRPPAEQPSLWCPFKVLENGFKAPDEEGKHYETLEWTIYLIKNILEPRSYICNGIIEREGEESGDFEKILVNNNKVYQSTALIVFSDDVLVYSKK